jgi:hypothetical protein
MNGPLVLDRPRVCDTRIDCRQPVDRPVQHLIQRYVTWRSYYRTRSAQRQFRRILALRENSELLRLQWVFNIIATLIIVAVVFITAGLYVVVVYIYRFGLSQQLFDVGRAIKFILSSIVALYYTFAMAAVIIITQSIRTAITYNRVVNFEQFKRSLEPFIDPIGTNSNSENVGRPVSGDGA